jgi:cell division protein ZapA
MPDPKVVHVEVQGQRYPIRTTLEPKYVQELASYVDRKMAMASEASPSSDTLGLAVLTALNIADEYFRARHQQRDEAGSLAERAEALERMVDHALELAGSPEQSS